MAAFKANFKGPGEFNPDFTASKKKKTGTSHA
jgi:hypothetical protein